MRKPRHSRSATCRLAASASRWVQTTNRAKARPDVQPSTLTNAVPPSSNPAPKAKRPSSSKARVATQRPAIPSAKGRRLAERCSREVDERERHRQCQRRQGGPPRCRESASERIHGADRKTSDDGVDPVHRRRSAELADRGEHRRGGVKELLPESAIITGDESRALELQSIDADEGCLDGGWEEVGAVDQERSCVGVGGAVSARNDELGVQRARGQHHEDRGGNHHDARRGGSRYRCMKGGGKAVADRQRNGDGQREVQVPPVLTNHCQHQA